MHWDAYTVFSVISGAVLIGLALLAGSKARDRAWCLIVGAGMIVYAFYVAGQTSGIYYFPVQIFIIPIGAIVYLLVLLYQRSTRDALQTAPLPPSAGAVTPVAPSSCYCEQCGNAVRVTARFCASCGHAQPAAQV